ncbi:hypothetical protein HS088_TW14G00794 [Tripterygium wilfordii]|uniref:Uncharacterized protein n=1 Tax=Tripterygium wilfordii TaxID=458696 RepID=A0A7J7CRB8_TRIWF|nr:hypothetical protein HS088_TW14G00794 [Tripterygium wilfordii]
MNIMNQTQTNHTTCKRRSLTHKPKSQLFIINVNRNPTNNIQKSGFNHKLRCWKLRNFSYKNEGLRDQKFEMQAIKKKNAARKAMNVRKKVSLRERKQSFVHDCPEGQIQEIDSVGEEARIQYGCHYVEADRGKGTFVGLPSSPWNRWLSLLRRRVVRVTKFGRAGPFGTSFQDYKEAARLETRSCRLRKKSRFCTKVAIDVKRYHVVNINSPDYQELHLTFDDRGISMAFKVENISTYRELYERHVVKVLREVGVGNRRGQAKAASLWKQMTNWFHWLVEFQICIGAFTLLR